MLGAILLTLASIAGTLGLEGLVRNYEERQANSQELTPDLILRDIKTIMAELEKQGPKVQSKINNKLAKLQDQINSLPYSQGVGTVKATIQKAIRDNKAEQARLMKMSEEVADQINKNQVEVNNITNRANTLAYQPSSYRSTGLGVADLNRIRSDAENLVQDNLEKLKGVEKNV